MMCGWLVFIWKQDRTRQPELQGPFTVKSGNFCLLRDAFLNPSGFSFEFANRDFQHLAHCREQLRESVRKHCVWYKLHSEKTGKDNSFVTLK